MTTITPKAARESKGYTVPQAARAAGVSPNTIYSLERGESIKLGNLVKIARALGVRAADLFEGWRTTNQKDLKMELKNHATTSDHDDDVRTARKVQKVRDAHLAWRRGDAAKPSHKNGIFTRGNFAGASLHGANFQDATLTGADFTDADLRDANFTGAWLRGANFQGATLTGADFSGARCNRATFSGADLRGADLRGAWFPQARFLGADLRDARLRGANFSDSNFSEARGVVHYSIAWQDHGRAGRQLTAVLIDNELKYFCGCFRGNEAGLREYIEQDHPALAPSRLFALQSILALCEFDENNVPPEFDENGEVVLHALR